MKAVLNEKIELLKTHKGRGINFILSEARKILDNPILMFDITYKLLAHTDDIVEDDYLWNEMIQMGTFSHKTVNFFSEEQFIDDVANTEIITILRSKKLKYDRVSAKIFDKDDIHIANICVMECYKKFDEEDFKNIEQICEILSAELQKSDYYKNLERVFEETFIGNLIEDKITDKTYVEKKMNELYENLKTNLYVAIIDITRYEETLTHLAYFRDLFKKNRSEFKYFIYLNNIVVIISTDDPVLNVKTELNDLKTFCTENNIYVGISSGFQNLFELQKYYKQALNALNYGLTFSDDSNKNIFEYDNFRLDYYLGTIENSDVLREMCHPIIFSIKEYDKRNKTGYYTILFTYLTSARSHEIAAKKCKMSYDKYCEEINNMTRIFGIDWDNEYMLVSIIITMKICRHFL